MRFGDLALIEFECGYARMASRSKSAPFSPITIEAALVFEVGMVGMIDESITRKHSIPRTLSS